MSASVQKIEEMVEKLRGLSPERLTEVEDFIDFLSYKDKDRGLTRAAMMASEPVLIRLWNNAGDADYDRL